MVVHSAGIALHRVGAAGVEVLIGHMGGPFWARKDEGAWSIPKGEYDPDGEPAHDAARREFREELGVDPPAGPAVDLGVFRYASGKLLHVFAIEAPDFPASGFSFGTFEREWPPRSGRVQTFPELDRAEWTPLALARPRLVKGQRPILDALVSASSSERR